LQTFSDPARHITTFAL